MTKNKIVYGFSYGFTRGLQCCLENMKSVIIDYKRMTGKTAREKQMDEISKVIINGREILRENPFAFVRYNSNGFFEVYEPKK